MVSIYVAIAVGRGALSHRLFIWYKKQCGNMHSYCLHQSEIPIVIIRCSCKSRVDIASFSRSFSMALCAREYTCK
jgi:hypothetical protein